MDIQTASLSIKPKGLCIVTRCASVDEFIARFFAFCDETSLFVNTHGTRAVGTESPFAILLADKTPVLRGWCVVFDAWTDSANVFGRPGLRVGLHRLTPSSKDVFARLQAARVAALASGVPLKRITQPIATPRVATEMGIVPLKRTTSSQRPLTVRIPDVSRRSTTETPASAGLDAIPDSALLDEPTERVELPFANTIVMGVAKPSTTTTPSPIALADASRPVAKSAPTVEGKLRRTAPVSRAPIEILAEGSSETRTPGSDLVLLANPLMNLTDESLEGFVDCRLYEETAPTDGPRLDDVAIIVDLPPSVDRSNTGEALVEPMGVHAGWRFVTAIALIAIAMAFLISFGVARWVKSQTPASPSEVGVLGTGQRAD